MRLDRHIKYTALVLTAKPHQVFLLKLETYRPVVPEKEGAIILKIP
jgi:hypothetical protein